MRSEATSQGPAINQITQNGKKRRAHVPFCFTFSNDTTRSDKEPGNAVGVVAAPVTLVFAPAAAAPGAGRGCCTGTCCDVDGGLCPICCWGGPSDDAVASSPCGTLTPGGNCGCVGSGELVDAIPIPGADIEYCWSCCGSGDNPEGGGTCCCCCCVACKNWELPLA